MSHRFARPALVLALATFAAASKAAPPAAHLARTPYRLVVTSDFSSRVRVLMSTKAAGMAARLGLTLEPIGDGLGNARFVDVAGAPSYVYNEGRDFRVMSAVLQQGRADVLPPLDQVVQLDARSKRPAAELAARRARKDVVDEQRYLHYVVAPDRAAPPTLAFSASGAVATSGTMRYAPMACSKGYWGLWRPWNNGAERLIGNAHALAGLLAAPWETTAALEAGARWRTTNTTFAATCASSVAMLFGDKAEEYLSSAQLGLVAMTWEVLSTAAGLEVSGKLEAPVPVRRDGNVIMRLAGCTRTTTLDPASGAVLADRASCTLDGFSMSFGGILGSVSGGSATLAYDLSVQGPEPQASVGLLGLPAPR